MRSPGGQPPARRHGGRRSSRRARFSVSSPRVDHLRGVAARCGDREGPITAALDARWRARASSARRDRVSPGRRRASRGGLTCDVRTRSVRAPDHHHADAALGAVDGPPLRRAIRAVSRRAARVPTAAAARRGAALPRLAGADLPKRGIEAVFLPNVPPIRRPGAIRPLIDRILMRRTCSAARRHRLDLGRLLVPTRSRRREGKAPASFRRRSRVP